MAAHTKDGAFGRASARTLGTLTREIAQEASMKTERPHHHRARRDGKGPGGYTGCVAPYNCDPSSHGAVTYIERCACGATRAVNVNQRFVERGPWSDPQERP